MRIIKVSKRRITSKKDLPTIKLLDQARDQNNPFKLKEYISLQRNC